MKQWITGGQVVLPEQTVAADIEIENGRITAIVAGSEKQRAKLDGEIVDASGCYVLPGLIDLHCDAIEKEVQPRPNTLFPLQMALLEFERKLPLHGITSMYHSLSLGVGLSLRGEHLVSEMVDLIHAYKSKRSVIRNGIHLRYEVSHLTGLPLIQRYIEEGLIDFLSFMDHSPGQGQYREPGSFERYVMKNQGVDVYEVQQIVDELNERRQRVDWEELKQLAGLAASRGIAIASHDDDTIERVEQSRALGCTVSEFPINLESAGYAADKGMYVCVGAPNVVRGASHDKNMRAADAIAAGAANILCSDYHPASLLLALFKLADEQIVPLHEAVRMATLHPAQALGIADRIGSIAVGCEADLLFVDRYEGHPWIVQTIVGGSSVYKAAVRSQFS
ncbi:alpha-D-ribose 1-methylphosphonate 5-triphosphate diphosphatase [Paenibacillus sp. GCM10027626]|uniref:alpha-D-ribose 1-methylphosphonate 5-triphosphate diphosphatase n=1 Tax=Paenibacillus sp. GCM10027626 TaxID=3273411 RepID=UPI00363FEC6A